MAENKFIEATIDKASQILSENGSLKYASIGSEFIDQFNNMGNYKEERPYPDIEKDCNTLWSIDKDLTVRFILYIRMISRITTLFDGKKTSEPQKGSELKHEGITRILWLGRKDRDVMFKNLPLFIAVGSWKDVFFLLRLDLEKGWENRTLDWKPIGDLILSGLNNPNHVNMIKKYLPQIRSSGNALTDNMKQTTIIAKWLCHLLFGNKTDSKSYKEYRKLKTSGTAHEWQKLISQQKHNLVNFDTIHGRALQKLVKGDYLRNHDLTDKYQKWVKVLETVKYTGFVHELFGDLPIDVTTLRPEVKETTNKQFGELINKGGEKLPTKYIVVRDTSGSMGNPASGSKLSCFNIAKSLALYFAEFLHGSFADYWIEFANTATMRKWVGETPVDRWYNDKTSFYGSTNFQSVIDLFCEMRKKEIPEEDFPQGILCVSDSEFNPAHINETNVQTARKKLKVSGFSETFCDNFVIVLWNLNRLGAGNKFETRGDVKNVFYFSGYSASVVSFLLTGQLETMSELFAKIMQQEVLNLVSL